ncbi:MFS transporter [Lentzea sp. NEAU-D7]|uniref:MFS transporter n=1 Tax=Lentzea sp. NEAU-D7 TaxID=2994667 RepID=UPI00224B166D|nr:MFS transporter [Lentzea sp. NEAU-D7]MCX2946985.1 MFS transporter [Lentzea sp. NEAU-D7]
MTTAPAGRNRLFVAVLVDTVGAGAFFPLTFLYLSETTDVPLARLGLVITAASLVGLPVTPLIGQLVDRFGAQRVLVAQTVVAAAGFSFYFHVTGLGVLVCGVALVTLSDRMYWATWPVFVGEQVGEEGLDRWYSTVNMVKSASLAAGGALGAAALATGGTDGLRVMLALNIASSLVAGALFLSVRGGRTARTAVPRGGWPALLRDGRYLQLAFANTLLTFGWLIPSLVLPLYVARYTVLPVWVAASALTVKMVLAAVLQSLVTARLGVLRRTTTAIVGAGFFLVAIVLLACASAVTGTAVAVALVFGGVVFLALGETAAGPAASSLSVAAAPPAWRGRYVAVFQMSWSISNISGPAIAGALLATSALAVWEVFAAFTGGAAIVLFLLRRRFPAEIDEKTPPREKTARHSAPA